MNAYKQFLDLASERFQIAEEKLLEEKHHTAAHLFINASINFHNALCQKFLEKIPHHKPHSDTSFLVELVDFLKEDSSRYRTAYEFLMAHKSESDYGIGLSIGIARQIERRAKTIKEIAEHRL